MEDDELVLKGSELEKLLASVREDIETFSPNLESQSCTSAPEPPPNPPIRNNSVSDKVVLAELICLKQLLLSCGLMLDEDIEFIVNKYPDHHEEKSYLKRLDQILLPGCFLMLIISSYRLLKNLKWSFLLLLSSVGPTVFISYKFIQVLRLRKRMKELLSEMNSLTRFINNTTKSIKETMTAVNTRLILSSFRKINPELMDRYYSQVKSDIDCNSHTFMKFLLETICITREATRRIIATGLLNNSFKSFFLASCSDEELGFPTFNEDSSTPISISKLEELRVEYLVMQSEYLRALGMWLCSPVHTTPDDVSSNISYYRENISKKHRIAQQVFSGALFTVYMKRTNLPIHGSTDIVLTKLNSALMTLIVEATSLKNCLNEIEHNSFSDGSYFEYGLTNLESCISDCTEIFNEVRSYSRKQKCKGNNKDSFEPSLEPENYLSAWKTGVQVGRSDFSVSGEDKVYLCITDIDESFLESSKQEYLLIDKAPKYPQSLLNELRGVLEEKRIEFRQRESNAIKNSDLEAIEDQFDLVLLNKPMEKCAEPSSPEPVNRQAVSITNQESSLPFNYQQFEDSHYVPSSSNFSLSKSIAATAAKTSAAWNCQPEEFFGDEDDSCDDISS